MKLHELREKRARVVTEMRALADKAEAEKRDLTVEEDSKFNELKATINDLDKKIGRAEVLAEAERSAPAVVHGRLGDGSFEERARDFSVVKAIRAAMPRDVGGGGVDAGFEHEISQEVARRSGRTFGGIAVPDEVFLTENRTLLAGSSAADLVPSIHRQDLFIDRLRSALVTERLGATVMSGLVGTIDIPRQAGSSAAQWVDEDGSLTETDAEFDDVTLAPKTVGAMTSYSRRTLLNSSPSVEQLVRNDLAAIIAQAIDGKAMIGNGTGNTPTGVINAGARDLSSITGPSWSDVLEFIAGIEAEDALEGSLAWTMNPYIVKKLRSTLVAVDTDSRMVMTDPNNLGGYPVARTTALPGDGGSSPSQPGTMIFGDWSQLLIGYWSGVDILVNPYETTAYAKGRVLVRAMRDVDVQVRHPEAFAFSNAIAF